MKRIDPPGLREPLVQPRMPLNLGRWTLEECLHLRFVDDLGQLGIRPAVGGAMDIRDILKEDRIAGQPLGNLPHARGQPMLKVNNSAREDEDHDEGQENSFQGCVWILVTELAMADGFKVKLP
jgi:hypothetical protein